MDKKLTLHGTIKLESQSEEFFLKMEIDPIEGNALWIFAPYAKLGHHDDNDLKYAHCKMQDGSVWTCLNLRLFSRSTSMPGHTVLQYDALWALKNAICDSIDEILIYDAAVNIEGLETWLAIYGFYDSKIDPDGNGAQAFYKKPEDILLYDVEDIGKVYANYIVQGHFTIKDFPVKQLLELYFEFASSNIKSLPETTNFINKFLSFFDLIWNEHPLKLNYRVSLKDTKSGELFEAEVYYRQRQPKHKLSNNFERFTFLKHKSIKDDILLYTKNWINLTKTIEPVINIAVEYHLEGSNLTTNAMLNLSQSLETFHRRLRKNQLLPKLEFEERKKHVLNLLEKKDSEWLKGIITYANEPSLVNRLDELIGEFPKSIISKIISKPDLFNKTIRDNRNYFTHFDKRYEEKNQVLNLLEMSVLNEKMYLFLVLLILKEVGINLSDLENGLEQNKYRLLALRDEFRNLF